MVIEAKLVTEPIDGPSTHVLADISRDPDVIIYMYGLIWGSRGFLWRGNSKHDTFESNTSCQMKSQITSVYFITLHALGNVEKNVSNSGKYILRDTKVYKRLVNVQCLKVNFNRLIGMSKTKWSYRIICSLNKGVAVLSVIYGYFATSDHHKIWLLWTWTLCCVHLAI